MKVSSNAATVAQIAPQWNSILCFIVKFMIILLHASGSGVLLLGNNEIHIRISGIGELDH